MLIHVHVAYSHGHSLSYTYRIFAWPFFILINIYSIFMWSFFLLNAYLHIRVVIHYTYRIGLRSSIYLVPIREVILYASF